MEQLTINGTECKIFATEQPEVLLIQPSARHEEKNNGVQREVELIKKQSKHGFAIVFFDCKEWARALMPWADEAVSRDEEVGQHAADTLHFIEHNLLSFLHRRYGALPCILGGYSLGGLFALWAARNSTAFAAIAAASPSLWISGWGEYAATHPLLHKAHEQENHNSEQEISEFAERTTQNSKLKIQNSILYLSLGDREEHCRNQRMQRIGDCVRAEYALLSAALNAPNSALGTAGNVVLKWNEGGHFGAEAERTADSFAWCMERILQQ